MSKRFVHLARSRFPTALWSNPIPTTLSRQWLARENTLSRQRETAIIVRARNLASSTSAGCNDATKTNNCTRPAEQVNWLWIGVSAVIFSGHFLYSQGPEYARKPQLLPVPPRTGPTGGEPASTQDNDENMPPPKGNDNQPRNKVVFLSAFVRCEVCSASFDAARTCLRLATFPAEVVAAATIPKAVVSARLFNLDARFDYLEKLVKSERASVELKESAYFGFLEQLHTLLDRHHGELSWMGLLHFSQIHNKLARDKADKAFDVTKTFFNQRKIFRWTIDREQAWNDALVFSKYKNSYLNSAALTPEMTLLLLPCLYIYAVSHDSSKKVIAEIKNLYSQSQTRPFGLNARTYFWLCSMNYLHLLLWRAFSKGPD